MYICLALSLAVTACGTPYPTQDLGYQLHHLQPPATLDGGDVLQLPRSQHILVGMSRRTNAAAVQQLQDALPQHSVHGVPVAHGLHLKSAVTALDAHTLVYADNEAGRSLRQVLQQHPVFTEHSSSDGRRDGGAGDVDGAGGGGQCAAGDDGGGHSRGCQHVLVEPGIANVLLLGPEHVVVHAGFPRSLQVLQQLAQERGLQVHQADISEFAKADAALTCCSIILPQL